MQYNILLNYTMIVTIFYPLVVLTNLEMSMKDEDPEKIACTLLKYLTDLSWLDLFEALQSESLKDVEKYLQYLYQVEGKSTDITNLVSADGSSMSLNPSNDYVPMLVSSAFTLFRLLSDIARPTESEDEG
jgi:hypothetical protein